MTYVAQLAGIAFGGFLFCFAVHAMTVYEITENREHYLVTFARKLGKILPHDLIVVGFMFAIVAGFISMLLTAVLVSEKYWDFSIWFAVGCGAYCQIPLWKTWFPAMFTQMFPGRKTR